MLKELFLLRPQSKVGYVLVAQPGSSFPNMRSLLARSGRPPNKGFADFVAGLSVPHTVLGLTHTTSAYVMRDIVASGEIIAPEKCRVMGEAVTYTYYGRALFEIDKIWSPRRWHLSSLQ